MTIAVCVVAVLSLSCGGGANDDPPSSAVLLTVDVDGNEGGASDFVAAEMVKNVANTTALVTIRAATSTNAPVDPTVGVITLRRYTVTFERVDGGSPTLPPVEGVINQTIEPDNITQTSGADSQADEDIIVVPTSAKLFSDFALAFNQNPNPVEFNATFTIFGDNRAGQNFERTAGFRLTCAVFGDTAELAPEILSFTESKNVIVGNPYRAFWNTARRTFPIFGASLILPWGPEVSIPSNQFPFGGAEVDTSSLINEIAPGATATYPAGQLFVFNAFGSASRVADGSTMDVTAPVAGGNSVSIDQFFPDRDTINVGESVNLNWSISGGPDRLSMLPASFGGVPVDFGGKNLSFDAIEIAPTQSVTPLLRAEKNDGSFAEQFLSRTIQVNSPNAGGPPTVAFFSASRDSAPVGSQIVLFWNIQGEFSKAELFPINGSRVEVTDRDSFLTPPVNLEGSQVYTLVVTGLDGTFVNQTVTVSYTLNDNEQIEISGLDQEPGTSLPNGGTASFSFVVTDPERLDSTWRVRRIAGDRASHFPTEGRIDDGLGDASVAVSDGLDFNNGYIVFEISAWDDNLFGLSPGSTRDVLLVTFQTPEESVDTNNELPAITEGPTFIEAGDSPEDTIPGVIGVITFAFADPDTQSLEWSIRIIGGDFGGDLTPNFGLSNTGEGEVSVQYRDDADTPDDPVIFEVRVEERGVENPQFDIAVLRVDKGTTTVGGGGGGGSGGSGPISLGFDGLYANLFGGVQETQVVRDYILFFPGTGSGNISFFRNSDLSGEVDGASAIFDFAHNTSDPGRITDADYARNFQTAGTIDNNGDMSFAGYFANAGANTASSNAPIPNGVSRWYMPFNVNSFQNTGGDYNLPASGNQVYQITISVSDVDTSTATFNRALTIVVPAP
ncbi:hypothetical protein [Acanthopleuribacter pedis]|uniref:hypothetical protein n=1 Tax=Acanthopleuribacter pedis TaxID=442870 RepID=UPI001A9F6734|nr:hypothetical protein [Acanthopleuribacter pedis]